MPKVPMTCPFTSRSGIFWLKPGTASVAEGLPFNFPTMGSPVLMIRCSSSKARQRAPAEEVEVGLADYLLRSAVGVTAAIQPALTRRTGCARP